MGVQGLWRLIDSTGVPVSLESLNGSVLAVDVSLWLHQAVKGFQDSRGASVPNAHLLSLYHRICKLLYFRIKPVFVFDGGVPALKKETIAKRNQSKSKHIRDADRIHRQLLKTLLKQTALNQVVSEKTKSTITSSPSLQEKKQSSLSPQNSNHDDLLLYQLPSTSSFSINNDSEVSFADENYSLNTEQKWDLHSIDTNSAEFKSLPLDVRHDILTDLKETRKQSSWGRLSELPTQSGEFATFQMCRLLKRQSVQKALDELEKEMGGQSMSLAELELLLQDQGVISRLMPIAERLASDENAQYVLIKDVRKALESVQSKSGDDDLIDILPSSSQSNSNNIGLDEESVEDDNLELAIALSLDSVPSSSRQINPENSNVKEDLIKLTEDDDLKRTIALSFESLPSSISKEISEKETINQTGEKKNNKVECTQNDYSAKIDEEILQSISKEGLTLVSSNSDSDDFEEVNSNNSDISINETEKPFEIHINPDDDSVQSDLFADVFTINSSETVINDQTESVINITNNEKLNVIQETSNENILSNQKSSSSTIILERDIILEDDAVVIESINESEQSKFKNLMEISEELRQEKDDLLKMQSSKERLGTNITDQMYQEAQELLKLFGIPYVVAPMEAEAQCAFFEQAQMTDGTITDDSDIWLFGGQVIYKNFFNPIRRTQLFKAQFIQQHLNLGREEMILFALLAGSDYTMGLKGVGPVTALEILASFPSVSNDLTSGLSSFRVWFLQENSEGTVKNHYYKSLRNKIKNITVGTHFPNGKIVDAYLHPTVDNSRERFSWASPNYQALIEFGRQKFGWLPKKSEAILMPIMKKLSSINDGKQASIRDYFYATKIKNPTLQLSKRVQMALGKFKGKEVEEESTKKISTNKMSKRENEKPVVNLGTDKDAGVLKQTIVESKKRTQQMKQIMKKEQIKRDKKSKVTTIVNQKEVIPQCEQDKAEMLQKKLKAIEVFRKSKRGPGYVVKAGPSKRRNYPVKLSDSSDSS